MRKSLMDAIQPADGWVDGTIDWISVEVHSYARTFTAQGRAYQGHYWYTSQYIMWPPLASNRCNKHIENVFQTWAGWFLAERIKKTVLLRPLFMVGQQRSKLIARWESLLSLIQYAVTSKMCFWATRHRNSSGDPTVNSIRHTTWMVILQLQRWPATLQEHRNFSRSRKQGVSQIRYRRIYAKNPWCNLSRSPPILTTYCTMSATSRM